MIPRPMLALLLLAAAWFMPRLVVASCVVPTQCYCGLEPNQCEVLVNAEILAISVEQITLRVLEEPFYDPDDIVNTGMELTFSNERSVVEDPEVGMRGLFLMHPPGACVISEPDEPFLRYALMESHGTYPCDTYWKFSTADRDALLDVVLGGNCSGDAWEWMGIEHYCEGESGCCHGGSASLGGILPMLLLGVALIPGRRRKKAS